MKFCSKLILFVLLLVPAISLAKQADVPEEELAPLVSTAMANNPDLKSSRARWQMFLERVPQASAFEDPMLMLKLDNALIRDPLSMGGKDPMTAKVIGISQKIPFWGKRAINEEIAREEAESSRWEIEERKLEISRLVREVYFQLYSVDRSLDVVARNIKLLADFVVIAESKYSVGKGVQQDIYKASLEKSKMLDLQIKLQQQRKSLQANLNYLLYRPLDTPVGKIPEFELPKVAAPPQELGKVALEKRPKVKALASDINRGQASYRLAQKEYYPDVTVSLEYMQREKAMNDPGYDMYSLGLTFNLPVQRSRLQAKVAEATSQIDMAREELNKTNNTINFSIVDTMTQIERLQQQINLYKKGIIPQAKQSLESSIISYRVNKVDFLTLLDGRINLFNYEKELYESQAEYMMKLAFLESVIGADPTALVP